MLERDDRRRTMTGAVRGAVAGVAATAAMTAVMLAAERAGIQGRQPPRRIVDRFAPSLDDDTARRLAFVSHGLYGAAGGVVFALLPGRRGPAPLPGVAYGLAIWAASYEGWVPAADVMPPAHRDRRGRVATMVAAHSVYGAVLGALARR